MLFVPCELADLATEIFLKYALAEDGDEPGADVRRLKTEIIDPSRGSATGYLAKYIAKNIDGFGLETDHYGKEAVVSAMRIEAWASTLGIRQFQQIGGPGVTVWRELRRLEECLEAGEEFEAIRRAADEGDWGEYTNLMGGAICPRRDRPLRPMTAEQKRPNEYGEIVTALIGIWHGTRAIISRIHIWTVSTVPIPIRESSDGSPGPYPGQDSRKNPYTGLPGIDAEEVGSPGLFDALVEYQNSGFFGSAPDGAGNLEYCH